MEKVNIVPGVEYAIRERHIAGLPFQRVRVLQHIHRNKWKAKWIEPNAGLVDYVESAQIIVPWKEHKAFLRDEDNAARMAERNEREGYEPDSPLSEAIEQVFEAVADGVGCRRGVLLGDPEALRRIRSRAKDVDPPEPVGAYTDRLGRVHWPFAAGLELARRFCAVEPATVLVSIEATEREWSAQASRPGEEYIIPVLNQFRASWALIRQWTGHDPAVAEREAYIDRLQRLVWDAIYALQKADLDSEAARLRRVLERH
jgi:hypothetical protein